MLIRCILTVISFLIAGPCRAHERWILSPDQVMQLNAQPKPEIFTMVTVEGTAILIVFAAATGALLSMHYGTTPAWLISISGRARKHAYYVPTVLRFCAAWTLISSAFGLEPQVGVDPMSEPSFMAPDLLIGALGPGWGWLAGAQVMLAIWLLVGACAQTAGLAVIALTAAGCGLWGSTMFAYAPVWFGVGYYLLVRGGGHYAYRMPIFSNFSDLFPQLLFRYPQLVLRLFAGLNFMYLGLYFKVMQPNLSLGIILEYDVPILSYAPETFVFLMAMIECCGGLLILAGIMIRLVATFLLGAFLFFAIFLPETFTAHMILYGVMAAFLLAGPGRTSRAGRYGKLHVKQA